MKASTRTCAYCIVASIAAAVAPSVSYGIAISPGSNSTGALGGTADAIVRVSAGGFVGSGTILKIQNTPNGGEDLLVLTADHVLRNAAGGGTQLYAPNQVSIGFGNQGGGGASFAAEAVSTIFDLPLDGSNAADLAMIDVFIPGSQLNTLPAGLTAVGLPGASPAANAAITQAGYGLQGSVVTVGGQLAYAFSNVFGDGADYGTLAAGPNTTGAGGVVAITGAVSDYAGQNYQYQGFTNGALINGVNPNYNGSTSYIFSGDSGGPSLVGNTIVGVHSSSVTGVLAGDANSEFAYNNVFRPNYRWQDVNVADYLPWINDQLINLSPVPEPATWVLMVFGSVAIVVWRRRQVR
jgi:hypothetical protein